jgi:hypothetical protein
MPPGVLTGTQQSLLGIIAIGDTWVRPIPSETRASIDILDDRQLRGSLDVAHDYARVRFAAPHLQAPRMTQSYQSTAGVKQGLLGALDQYLASIHYPIVRPALAMIPKSDIDAMYRVPRQSCVVVAVSCRAFSIKYLVHEFFLELNVLATNAGRLD